MNCYWRCTYRQQLRFIEHPISGAKEKKNTDLTGYGFYLIWSRDLVKLLHFHDIFNLVILVIHCLRFFHVLFFKKAACQLFINRREEYSIPNWFSSLSNSLFILFFFSMKKPTLGESQLEILFMWDFILILVENENRFVWLFI